MNPQHLPWWSLALTYSPHDDPVTRVPFKILPLGRRADVKIPFFSTYLYGHCQVIEETM